MLLDITPTLTRSDPIAFAFSWQAEDLDLGPGLILRRPVLVEGLCTLNSDIFLLEGTIRFAYAAFCDRCLEPLEKAIRVDYREEFVHVEDPEFPDRYLFTGQTLDLTPMARDLVLLNIPLQNLCKPDCKGLCPVCGVNRNETPCNCAQDDERENPFLVLKTLLQHQEEET